jgi:hypothetical protein
MAITLIRPFSTGGWRRQTEAESCSKPSQINSLLSLLDLMKHGG